MLEQFGKFSAVYDGTTPYLDSETIRSLVERSIMSDRDPRLNRLKRNSAYNFVDWSKRITKEESPFGYDMFWRLRRNCQEVDSWYHTALQQDIGSWQRAVGEVPSKFEHMTQSQLSQWLSSYWLKPMTCEGLIEGCNIAIGKPFFILFGRIRS